MKKGVYKSICLVALLSCFVLSGCSILGNAPKGLEANQSIKEYDETSWESNRAVLIAAEQSQNYELMLATGREVIAKDPSNALARIYTARAMTRTGDPSQALRTLSYIEKIDKYPEAVLEKARAQISLGAYADASSSLEALYKTLYKNNDEDERELFRETKKLLAVSKALNRDFPASFNVFEELLAENDEPTVRYNYARALMFNNDYAKAYETLKPIIERYPKAKNAAAAALIKLGQIDKARAVLGKDISDDDFNNLLAL